MCIYLVPLTEHRFRNGARKAFRFRTLYAGASLIVPQILEGTLEDHQIAIGAEVVVAAITRMRYVVVNATIAYQTHRPIVLNAKIKL